MKKIFATLALCAAATSSYAATLTFTETEFAEEDFSFVRFKGDEGGQVVTRVDTEHFDNALQIRTVDSSPRTSNAVLIHAATIDLSESLPEFFDVSIDFSVQPGAFGNGQTAGLLIKQGEKFFAHSFRTGTQTGLQTFTVSGLSSEDLSSLGDQDDFLDLSAGGQDLELGFYTTNLSGNGNTVVYDNFSVTVTGGEISPVPLPASIPLLATGVGVLAALRRRHGRKKAV